MEKIIVELNRKTCEIELSNPTHGQMQELRKFSTGKLFELAQLQKKAEQNPDTLTKEEIETLFKTLEEKEEKYNEAIIVCCTNSVIRETTDFKNMSADGVRKLYAWLEEKTGLGEGGKKKDFTKT